MKENHPHSCEPTITPEMIEAGALELWDWVLRNGYNDTFLPDMAEEPARLILNAALNRKASC